MSDLFDKFVFDLQRFDRATIQFGDISPTGGYSWGGEATQPHALLTFTGSTSEASLDVMYTPGTPSTITELNGVTLVGSGHNITGAGLSYDANESKAIGPVKIYNTAGGSITFTTGDASDGTFNFETGAVGSEYFLFVSGENPTFDFSGVSAGLKYNNFAYGSLSTLTYNNGKSLGIDIQLSQAGNENLWLRRTKQDEFVASGLSLAGEGDGDQVMLGDKTFQVTGGSGGSAAVAFSVVDNSGADTFTKATVDSGIAVQVTGVSTAIKINEADVQVNTDLFVFTRVGGGSGAIDLTTATAPADGIVVSHTGNAAQVRLASLSNASVTIGDTDFVATAGGSGFSFEVANDKATGVSGIDENDEYITGAFFKGGNSSFTFNGESVGFTANDDSHKYTFLYSDSYGGFALSGLVNDDAIDNAGGISTFITNEITTSTTFTIRGESMAFDGTDSDGVQFNFTGAESFAGVSGLNKDLYVEGDFTTGDITINGVSLATNDDTLKLFGMGLSNADANGIGKIEGFTGGDSSAPNSITNAGGASFIFTDGEGYFLVGSQSFGTKGDDQIEFVMQGGESTTVLGISGFGGEKDATLTGALSTVWINAENKSLSVVGDADNEFTYMYRAGSGSYVLGGVSGDGTKLVTINGIAGANIVQVTGSGSYAFNLPGGDSATFEVALGGSDANGVEFLFDKSGNLLGISSVDEGAEVIGDFSGSAIAIEGMNGTDGPLKTTVQVDGDSSVGVYHDAFNLTYLSDGASIVSAAGISFAYTDALVGGTSITIVDKTNNSFSLSAPNNSASVMFMLDGNGKIVGVDNLGAGVSLEGGLSALTSINGETFDIQGVSGKELTFGVVGAASGISEIFNLAGNDRVWVNDAGGASIIRALEADTIYFKNNAPESLGGISINSNYGGFTFGLSEGKDAYVTSIDGLSEGYATADNSLFAAGLSVNGKTIGIVGDQGMLEVGAMSATDGISYIAHVGGESVTINNAGGASSVETDMAGMFNFASASQVVTIGGDSNVGFLMDITQPAAISGIASLDAGGYVDASASLFVGGNAITVNGQSVLITDDDSFRLWGTSNHDGIGIIDNLSDSAIVTATGGASIARTDEIGTFTFGSTSFKLEGTDTVVDFALSAPTTDVLGVTGFGSLSDGTKVDAKITGALSGIYINEEGKNINVTGDVDERFSYAVDAEGFATLGGVSGDGSTLVEINSAASATFIAVEGEGKYQFFSESNTFTVGLSAGDADGLVFQVVDEKFVGGISSFEKGDTVIGNFNAGVIINGSQTVQILGDSSVTLFYDDIIIRDLTTNATISVADNINEAWTDAIAAGASFEVTDKSGDKFTVYGGAAGQSVMFVLDDAEIVGISGLAADMTLIGSASVFESGFEVNGLSVVVSGDPNEVGVVGSSESGITSIISLTGGANVAKAGGASYAYTDSDGTFIFTNAPSGITISGDSNVKFVFNEGENVDKANVGGISQFDGWLTAGASFFENFTVNGQSINIQNDAEDLAVLGISGGIGAISKVGPADNAYGASGVQVINAGGASQITTDKTGGFSFAASGQEFMLFGDSSVTFGLSNGNVETIDDFAANGESAAVILGKLNDVVINGSLSFDVTVDGNSSVNLGYAVYNGEKYLSTYDTTGASSVVVNNAGDANYFVTTNEGEFKFAGNSAFTVEGDSSVVFELSESNPATAAGVSYLGVGEAIGGASHYGADVAATITGYLNDFTKGINNSGQSIAVEGDEDKIFSFAVDDQGIGTGEHATLGSVSGTGLIEINGLGGASVLEITGGGSYQFFDDKTFTYESESGTFSKDGVAQFVLNGTSVAEINSFDKGDTVSGDFTTAVLFNQSGSGLDQATVQVSGDEDISVIYDDIIIRNLSNSAVFEQVRGVGEAWTDIMTSGTSSITVTDEADHTFTVIGKDADGVQFLVNKEKGEIYGVSSLDEDVTLQGALDALSSINGRMFDIKGDDNFVVVGSESAQGIGAIYGLGSASGVTINNAGGASYIYTNEEGPFYFRQGSASSEPLYGVTLGTDDPDEPNNNAVFELNPEKDSYAIGVSGLNYEVNYAGADHTLFEDGFKVNGESVVIKGDEDDLVVYALSAATDGVGIQFIANVGSSSSVVEIIDIGSASFLMTDKESTLAFGADGENGTFITGGDSYVGFYMENGGTSVTEIGNLDDNGWVEADHTILNKMTINNSAFDIENDENDIRVYGKGDLGIDKDWDDLDDDIAEEFGDGITKITKVGSASGTVIVNSAGSATTIQTDQNGDFYFVAKGQSFYVEDKDEITEFVMDGSESGAVIGIEGLSEGTIVFNTATSALDVNTVQYPAQSLSFAWGNGQDSITLTVDPYEVTEVSKLAAGGAVSGVVGYDTDATVWAEGPVTVNGKFIDITDSDSEYGIIVTSGSSSTEGTAQEAVGVTGDDATVNVADFTVTADGNGEFWIGGESFTFDDKEKAFQFTTNEAKELNSVSALNGTLVDHDGNVDLDGFNGDGAIKVSNDEEVTLGGDGNNLTSISELNDGAVVDGDLDHASVAVATNDDTVAVTVNDNPYTFIGDEDGVTIIGADDKGIGRVVGLDDGASLKIAVAGNYSVNKVDSSDATTVLSAKAGDIIIGSDNGTNAYIYDGSNPLIREKTPLDVVEGVTGIPSNGYTNVGGPSDLTKAHTPTTYGPLNIRETNILQGYMSASAAAEAYPQMDTRYNSSLDVDFDQPLEIWINNDNSTDNQDLNMSTYRYAKKVHMFEGPQSVEFNNEGGNLAHIESVASGHKTVDLGDGGDVVVMDEKAAVGNSVSIVGGLKADSIFVRDSANTTVDVSAGGADKIITYAGAGARVTVVGYAPSMEGGIKIDELQSTDMLAAIMGQSSGLNINFGDGVVSIENTNSDKHSEISLGADANNATFVNLFDYQNNPVPVGFTGIDGGTLDVGSTENDPLILVGNYKGNKTAGSVILGGAGPDIVLAGDQDSVDARGGNNTVILQDNAEREGAVIALTQGRTVVHNMNNTLAASTGDTIVLSANNIKNFMFYGNNVTIDGNGFYGILENVDEGLEGDYVTQYIYNSDNSTVYKAAGARAGGTIYLPKDEDVRPNAFFGMNSGIDFGNYADPQTVMIDLKGDMAESSIGGSPIYTRGITGLYGYYYDYDNPVATKEDLIFKGSDANDTLVAGNGNTSLYGDGGKNWLQGSYDYDETLSDKEGRVTFFVIGNANGAANTISNFEYVSDNNYKDTSRVTADQIEILEEQSEVVYADVSNNDVYIEVASFGGENKESVVLQNAIDTVTGYGKDFIVSGNVAQVGKNKVLVDRFGEFYMATEKNATIDVKEEGSPVTVWLDNPETGKTFRGDFAVINAATLTSNAQLAGLGTKENTIIGGLGNNSLWGGEGSSNDVLIGGAGKNTFFYGLGNGQDTIEANDGDEVVLGISIDDIIESQSSIGDTSLTLKLRDGGSLTVNDGGGIVDYKLTNSEGVQETYYLDSNRQFKQR